MGSKRFITWVLLIYRVGTKMSSWNNGPPPIIINDDVIMNKPPLYGDLYPDSQSETSFAYTANKNNKYNNNITDNNNNKNSGKITISNRSSAASNISRFHQNVAVPSSSSVLDTLGLEGHMEGSNNSETTNKLTCMKKKHQICAVVTVVGIVNAILILWLVIK